MHVSLDDVTELDAEELFMTAGERLVRHGFERAQRRGQALARRDDLLWLLDRRFGPLPADVNRAHRCGMPVRARPLVPARARRRESR